MIDTRRIQNDLQSVEESNRRLDVSSRELESLIQRKKRQISKKEENINALTRQLEQNKHELEIELSALKKDEEKLATNKATSLKYLADIKKLKVNLEEASSKSNKERF